MRRRSNPQEHELTTWLNQNEIIGFNAASLAPVANYARKGRAMAFTGPGIAVRLARHRRAAQRRLAAGRASSAVRRICRSSNSSRRNIPAFVRRGEPSSGRSAPGKTGPIPVRGIWTVKSDQPLADADRLLAAFLPQGLSPAGG